MTGFKDGTTTIGDFEYKTRQLGGVTGRHVFMKGVLAGGVEKMPEADLDSVFEIFQKNSSVRSIGETEWKPLETKAFFDIHFSGRILEQFKFLKFCWNHNFEGVESPKESGADQGPEKAKDG